MAFQELDKADTVHKAWWDAFLFLCDEELRVAEARRQDDKANLRKTNFDDAPRQRDVGINSSLVEAVEEHLAGLLLCCSTNLQASCNL